MELRQSEDMKWPSGHEKFAGTTKVVARDFSGLPFVVKARYFEDGLGEVEEVLIAPSHRPVLSVRRYIERPDLDSDIFIDGSADLSVVLGQLERLYMRWAESQPAGPRREQALSVATALAVAAS